jgi:hypothetical protein
MIGNFILVCLPSMQWMQFGKFHLVKMSSHILENVPSVRNGMCCNCNISNIALQVSSIIEPVVLCAILNENASPVTAIRVDRYLKLVRNH